MRNRWVVYAKSNHYSTQDSSTVPPEWHPWLHYISDDNPTNVRGGGGGREGTVPPPLCSSCIPLSFAAAILFRWCVRAAPPRRPRADARSAWRRRCLPPASACLQSEWKKQVYAVDAEAHPSLTVGGAIHQPKGAWSNPQKLTWRKYEAWRP